MRLPTAKILAAVVMGVGALHSNAQSIVVANPLEWAALAEGNELVNGQVKKETEGQLQTAALQNTIAAEFTKIHEWEKQYSNYLQKVDGYASTLKASTHLYTEGVRIFLSLTELKKAIGNNPQGIVASMSMNNLYMETATEMVSVYTLLKNAIAEGGVRNMLTGAERSQTLWALNERLAAFQKKLRRLCLSIRYYTFNDVWASVTAGMIDRDNVTIARQAKARWKRVAKSIHP